MKESVMSNHRCLAPAQRRGFSGLAFVSMLLLAGCAAQGPKHLPQDRFDYTEAISESSTQQMLSNLVRLRYLRIPTFLTVSSVITGYAYQGEVEARGQAGLSDPPVGGAGSFVGGSANIGYTERPTITYTPLSGQAFTHRMIRPIPIDAISSLGQSGWPVDLLLLTSISRINDVENLSFAPVPMPGEIDKERKSQGDIKQFKEYKRILKILLFMIDTEIAEFKFRTDKSNDLEFVIDKKIPPESLPLVTELRTKLGLDPTRNSFRITSRVTGRAPDEISIQTRSLMAIMLFLSKGVDAPAEDLTEGVVLPGLTELDDPQEPAIPLKIRTSRNPPDRAYVAVQYRDNWFYVEDSDIRSKRTFVLLTFLFELQAPSGGGAAPVLTLPAG